MRLHILLCLATVFFLAMAASTFAQQQIYQPVAQSSAQPFATKRPAAVPASQPLNESVTFSQRSASVGDQVEQTIAVDLRLKTAARQGQQIIEEANTTLQRDHQRVMTTTAAPQGRSQAATVTYRKASRTVNGGEAESEPVVGKTYHCQREGEALKVTTPTGTLPPMGEYQIVAQNMETLGIENPLTKFFHGRTVRVGEKIDLPVELATRILGFEEQLGKATRFTLTLTEIREIQGRRCAVFKTQIAASNAKNGQMGLLVEGPLVMQVKACRAVSAEYTGPIGMSETRAVPGGPTLQITGTGQLKVAIRTRYRDAR